MFVGNLFEGRRPQPIPNGMPKLSLPGIEFVFALFLLVFALVLVFRILGVFRPPGTYRQADSDVLFPTPISPRLVMAHRFVIDYMVTLFVPVIILIFGGRRSAEGISLLFENLPDPAHAPMVGKTMIGAFLLVSLFGVALSYALGMFINRDSSAARLARKATLSVLVAFGLAFGAVIVAAFRQEDTVKFLVELASSDATRLILYPAAAAAEFALMPIYANWTSGLVGAGFLLIGSVTLIGIALKQADHLYDMAARHSAASLGRQEVQRSGDLGLAFVQAAREGRLKVRRLRFLQESKVVGPFAMLWRETLFVMRTQVSFTILFVVMTCGISLLAVLDASDRFVGVVLPLQALLIGSFALGIGQSGFLEMLRRVDLQKPLPFSPLSICLIEIIAHSLVPILISLLAALTLLLARPSAYEFALAGAIGLPSIAVVVTAVQLAVLLLFPDMDDPTQRSFRALIQMLGSVLALTPAMLGVIPLLFLGAWPPFIAMFAVAANVVVVYIVAKIAESLYIRHNPAD